MILTVPAPDLKLAARLFDDLRAATRAGAGIVRDSYGDGEQAAHDLVRRAAEALDLDIAVDAIGNMTMTLPGEDRRAPAVLIGSHWDSVPQGGNYDGAAGVVAGLSALSARLRYSVYDIAAGVTATLGELVAWTAVKAPGFQTAWQPRPVRSAYHAYIDWIAAQRGVPS